MVHAPLTRMLVQLLAPARAKGLRFIEDFSAEYATGDFAHLWFGLLRCFHTQPRQVLGLLPKSFAATQLLQKVALNS